MRCQTSQHEAIHLALRIYSTAFIDGETIPDRFTCEDSDVNPELVIEGVPQGTKSLALIVDDPDAPSKTWEHWTVINIPPSTERIQENSVPGKELTNDFQRVSWGGPCPPPGKPHRYAFRLYALDAELDLEESAKKADVLKAIEGRVLEEAVLTGTYGR